jgi:hypothetical protein
MVRRFPQPQVQEFRSASQLTESNLDQVWIEVVRSAPESRDPTGKTQRRENAGEVQRLHSARFMIS